MPPHLTTPQASQQPTPTSYPPVDACSTTISSINDVHILYRLHPNHTNHPGFKVFIDNLTLLTERIAFLVSPNSGIDYTPFQHDLIDCELESIRYAMETMRRALREYIVERKRGAMSRFMAWEELEKRVKLNGKEVEEVTKEGRKEAEGYWGNMWELNKIYIDGAKMFMDSAFAAVDMIEMVRVSGNGGVGRDWSGWGGWCELQYREVMRNWVKLDYVTLMMIEEGWDAGNWGAEERRGELGNIDWGAILSSAFKQGP